MAPKIPQATEPKRVCLTGDDPIGYGVELRQQKKEWDLNEAKAGRQSSNEQRSRAVKHSQKDIKEYNKSTEKSRKKAQREMNKQHRQQRPGGSSCCAVM
jgi:hypothetical protein